eukprot:1189796-Prorocentrum_minimum.AAC.1
MGLEFVATVDLGPLAVSRRHFLELGRFTETYSEKGAPGPGLGIELSARAWLAGRQVALADNGRNFRCERWRPHVTASHERYRLVLTRRNCLDAKRAPLSFGLEISKKSGNENGNFPNFPNRFF